MFSNLILRNSKRNRKKKRAVFRFIDYFHCCFLYHPFALQTGCDGLSCENGK